MLELAYRKIYFSTCQPVLGVGKVKSLGGWHSTYFVGRLLLIVSFSFLMANQSYVQTVAFHLNLSFDISITFVLAQYEAEL